MIITNKVLFFTDIPYAFDRDGQHHEGVTRRVVVLTLRDGQPWRLDICKATPDFTMPDGMLGKPVTLLYDRFGRLVGWQ